MVSIPRSSAKRSYRKRVSKSGCRGKTPVQCRRSRKCKYVSKVSVKTKKLSTYCRKSGNTKRK